MSIIIVSSATERLDALGDLLEEFFRGDDDDEAVGALSAFHGLTRDLSEYGEATIRRLARRFAAKFAKCYGGVRAPGEAENLEGSWLLGVRIGVEIGKALPEESDN